MQKHLAIARDYLGRSENIYVSPAYIDRGKMKPKYKFDEFTRELKDSDFLNGTDGVLLHLGKGGYIQLDLDGDMAVKWMADTGYTIETLKKIAWVVKSPRRGGYHIYFKDDNNIDKDIVELEDIAIDIHRGNQTGRLPGSTYPKNKAKTYEDINYKTEPEIIPEDLSGQLKEKADELFRNKKSSYKTNITGTIDIPIPALRNILDALDVTQFRGYTKWKNFCISVIATFGNDDDVIQILDDWCHNDPFYADAKNDFRGISPGGSITESTFFWFLSDHGIPSVLWDQYVIKKKYMKTDVGNVDKIIDDFGHDIRYCSYSQTAYVWNGKKWDSESENVFVRFAEKCSRMLFEEADEESDLKWAASSQSAGKIKGVASLLKHDIRITIKHSDMNTDPKLFNVQNGTINLKTGEFRSHDRFDYITKISPVEYDPTVQENKILKTFLSDIFENDKEITSYVQKLLGLGLSGETKRIFPIFYGDGRNGKSTLIDIIINILGNGEYYQTCDPEILLRQKNGSNRFATSSLYGARFVAALETDEGRSIDAGMIKAITGGDMIRAEQKFKDGFQFKPEFTVALITNHRPHINDTSSGMRDRVVSVPFEYMIPNEKINTNIVNDIFKADNGKGALKWFVDGAIMALNGDLKPPKKLQEISEDYINNEDQIYRYLNECFIYGDYLDSKEHRQSPAEIFSTYRNWCEGCGERPMSKMALCRRITALHEPSESKKVGKGNVRAYFHIKAVAESSEDEILQFSRQNIVLEKGNRKESELFEDVIPF